MPFLDTPSHSLRSFHRLDTYPAWRDKADTLLNQVCAGILLVAFSPVLIAIGCLVFATGCRSVLFAHYRVSQSGKLFKCLKFRSMYPNADYLLANLLANDDALRRQWEKEQKLDRDPRVTPIGRLLRTTSLDELPQLFNVLKGEMRLVGPRPITVAELERYGATRWHYLNVRPGMTGLWQVSGRNNTTYAERVALDKLYVEQRSLKLDLSILLKTILVVLLRRGAR